MFRNYLKVGIRNILKYKSFSFINVFGLALAMSVCMLIILMLADQMRYDQFHVDKERIYRILSDDSNSPFPYASSAVPLANVLSSDYPVVEESVHLIRGVGGDAIYREKTFEMRGFFTNPSFFQVFTFELEKGNNALALASPNSMVISQELAERMFKDEDPLGKTIEFADRGLHYLGGYRNEPAPTPWGNFVITGVIKNTGDPSHLKFDVLVSSASLPLLTADKKVNDLSGNWENVYECFTYVLLTEGKSGNDLDNALDDLTKRQYAQLEFFKDFRLEGQRLTDITPGKFTANPTSFSMPLIGYYVLGVLALIIMASACLNYTGLSIARSLTRAKEIGVRKVAGANKRALVFQFMSESILAAIFAVVMASIMLFFMAPAFQRLWVNQYLHFDLHPTVSVYAIFLVFGLLIGSVAGLYPAWHLSGYQPIKALKSHSNGRSGKLGVRKALTVLQFVISLLFITTSILIFNQFKHFLEFDYGMQSKNIVNIPLQGNDYQKVSGELSSVPGVAAISACDIIPATGISNGTRLRKGNQASVKDDEYKYFDTLQTDENFVKNFGLELVAGMNIPDQRAAQGGFILLNEAAVKELGYDHPAEIIGEVFEEEGTSEAVEVIGVVKDFRLRMLIEQNEIGPMLLRSASNFNFINVAIVGVDTERTLAGIEQQWKNIDPKHPFKYEFFDAQLAKTHQAIFDAVSIIGFIALLAIVIACLGLLGMSTYAAERRVKEIGIRKILGAESLSIAMLLSRGFLNVLLVSVAIGAPLSYLANNLWLQKLPNRVEFGVETVFSGTVILLVLGLFTIGSQTFRVSRRNPVESIRRD
ncbi:MAG TPA: ABC transporter permease [Chryseolinea sp.]|nr:ABC transporter permease [Chryseolinea sp.]